MPGEARTGQELARSSHDVQRPAVDTARAARLLGVSRQAVIDAIKRGSLPGYCIPGAQRMRWYVYSDALDPAHDRARQAAEEAARLRERLMATENALAATRASAEARRQSHELFEQATAHLAEANKAFMAAYKKLEGALELESAVAESAWIPNYPPGGG